MAAGSLETFVSDNLLVHLGQSDSATVQFFIALAAKAKSADALVSTLAANGLPANAAVVSFASQLFARAPRKHQQGSATTSKAQQAQEAARKKAEREREAMQKQRFSLVLDDDNDGNAHSTAATSKRKGSSKNGTQPASKDRAATAPSGSSKTAIRRKQSDADDAWQSDEEERAIKRRRAEERYALEDAQAAARDRSTTADGGDGTAATEEDEQTRRERERLQDLKERDEFAQRMKEREKEKTRNIVEDRSSKNDIESAARRALASDPNALGNALPALRHRSRQAYLGKREQQQLDLLRLEIADDEREFRGVKLTRREREELERKKELLRLAEERLAIDEGFDGYQMPDDYENEQGKIDSRRKKDVLSARYQDVKPRSRQGKDSEFITDLEQYEMEQTAKAQLATGAMDREAVQDEYDFVFDDSVKIAFALDADSKIEGTMSLKDAALQAQIDEAERRAQSIDEVRKSLPVYEWREQFLAAVREYQVVIIEGETGSGKTTQLPQYLHEGGFTKGGLKIGCTQPRRVAAMSVAARVAEEMGCRVGAEVGYSIRFEDCTSDKTVIKYMTDGMLLREFLTEPDLAAYSVMIIDEAHERTLSTDILLGLVKDIARFRPEFRLLISSATLNASKFSDYFDEAPIFRIPGRRYPVDILYTPQPEANYLHAAVTTVFQIHTSQPKGDILVFLTGQDEIEAAQENIEETARALGNKVAELIICPIYANLPTDMQAKIFEPTPEGARKVVLATNIAETSITIDGVVYVIDPGFVKQNSYNPRSGMESLVVVPRAGRAGRVGPGKCFRLYTKHAYMHELEEDTVPEIQRTNLGTVVLMLKSLGINDLLGFDFLDPPPGDTLVRAFDLLYALGALNDRGELTKLGRRMAEFPMDPALSKAILASEKYHCTEEILTIVSMLSESGSLFYRPKQKKLEADTARQNFVRPGGDHFTLLNVWDQWQESGFSVSWTYEHFIQIKSLTRVRDIRDQLVQLCERVEIFVEGNPNSSDILPIQKAICAGYFQNTGRLNRSGDGYRTVKTNQTVHIHPSSSMFQHQPPPKVVLWYELVLTSREYARQVMEIKSEWLLEVAPHYFKKTEFETTKPTRQKKGGGRGGRGGGGGARRSTARSERWADPELKSEKFEAYYKAQNIVPDEEWEQLMATLREPLPTTFRITGSREQQMIKDVFVPYLTGIEYEGVPLEAPKPLEWYPQGFAWSLKAPRQAIRKQEAFKRFQHFLVHEAEVGNISRQEAVSMIPPLMLDVQPEHFVLDMCAAPGSKSVQLLEALQIRTAQSATSPDSGPAAMTLPPGLLIANDSDSKRCHLLVHQSLHRVPGSNMMVTNHDATQLPGLRLPADMLPSGGKATEKRKYTPVLFDRILADVPCSGDGTMRKNVGIWKDFTAGNGLGLHALQLRILMRGIALLKPGGKLVYSTCSMNPIENEAVVSAALDAYMSLMDASSELPALRRRPGLTTWQVIDNSMTALSHPDEEHPDDAGEELGNRKRKTWARTLWPNGKEAERNLDRCLRVYPHLQDTGGFFIAVLQKAGSIVPASNGGQRRPLADTNEHNDVKRVKTDSDVTAAAEQEAVPEDKSTPPEEEDKTETPVEASDSVPAANSLSGVPADVVGSTFRPTDFKEEPFVYLSADDEQVKIIKDFFDLDDSFPITSLLVRNSQGAALRSVYFTSEVVRALLFSNTYSRMRLISCGVKMFTRQDSSKDGTYRCKWRVNAEGLEVLRPFMGPKRITTANVTTLRQLMSSMTVNFADLQEEQFKQRLNEVEPGSCVLEVDASGEGVAFQQKLVLPFWKSRVSCNLMVEKADKSALSQRLFGEDITPHRPGAKARDQKADGGADSAAEVTDQTEDGPKGDEANVLPTEVAVAAPPDSTA
ncbi:hypothetical protein OIV83_006140 [Microbotryomycetes sp. JL201]|nr:hypothetical protein OIV83_006140 [Microbotryomycetes sp. JL201]